ncbi:MAG: competence/damage-inducible protein A [Candidatus Marinimicrobia bacterium]|nr:competence/damage-inducible protein A [Candidatus Neomarinimicrobiota bacterium]
MKIAVLTIGDEILSGYTLNTNAAWIGQQLLQIGVDVNNQTTASDNKEEILKYLNYLTEEKYTHIIVTGGLGPTHDDVTPSAFYQFFGAKPVFDENYWEELKYRFAKRNIKIPEKNRNQARRPNIGNVIDNPLGSARGLHFERDGIKYFALPGVPAEMKTMMESSIIPLIQDDSGIDMFVKTVRTIGQGESAIAENIEHLIEKYSPKIKVAFLPKLNRVDIRLFSTNKELLDQFVNNIEEILAEKIYGYDEDTIENAVAKLLIINKMTIATAESCTGGLLAHRLTNVSGSSKYLLGGIVSYSNEVKIAKVGVKKKTIIAHGAVSEQTVSEMATGIQEKFQADIGIGITGIAGPTGGTDEKPVGLVYIGLAIKDKLIVKRFMFLKDRKANKLLSSLTALNMLRLQLLK